MRRALLLVEFALLFFGVPLVYLLDLVPLSPIPALWVLSGVCLAMLLLAPDFDRRRLWNTRRLAPRAARALVPFLIAAPLLALATAIWWPERLFAFVRERPLVWLAVMLLYPVLSAYPQGIVSRAFIFHRYRELFPGRWARILASGIAFSVVHVIFQNWIAPLLTLLGGILFAWTYERTRSSFVATLQHALFGCFLFTIGLGWYFYFAALSRG